MTYAFKLALTKLDHVRTVNDPNLHILAGEGRECHPDSEKYNIVVLRFLLAYPLITRPHQYMNIAIDLLFHAKSPLSRFPNRLNTVDVLT